MVLMFESLEMATFQWEIQTFINDALRPTRMACTGSCATLGANTGERWDTSGGWDYGMMLRVAGYTMTYTPLFIINGALIQCTIYSY